MRLLCRSELTTQELRAVKIAVATASWKCFYETCDTICRNDPGFLLNDSTKGTKSLSGVYGSGAEQTYKPCRDRMDMEK